MPHLTSANRVLHSSSRIDRKTVKILSLILLLCALAPLAATQTPPPASFVSSRVFASGPVQNTTPAIAVGDMNNDGIPDLVTNGSSNNNSGVSVLLGNGDGTFRLAAFESAPSYDGGYAVALGDFNRDGNMDVAMQVGASPAQIYIFLGDGTGNLTGPTVYTIGNWCCGNYGNIAVADVNGDHKLDLVTTNKYDGTISILFGNGDGTFTAQPVITLGTTDDWIAIADVNQDGKPDLVVACYSSCPGGTAGFSVLLNNGNGTFGTPVFYGGLPKGVNGLAVGDVNGDSKLDVVTASDGTGAGASVFLGNGDGTFQAPVSYYAPYAASIAIAKLNGEPDLVLTDFQDSTTWVLLGNGKGVFQPAVAYATDWEPQGLALADFNKDGNLDFAVGSSRGTFVSLALGNGDGTFRAGVNYGLTQASQVFQIVTADFNGDGYLDIVQAGGVSANNATTVMLGSAHGVLGAPIAGPALCSSPTTVDAGDVNGDGKPDIVVGTSCDGEVAVLLGKGNGTFNAPVYYSTGDSNSEPAVVKLADLTGNGSLDIVVSNNDGSVSILPNNGKGKFGTASVITGVTGGGEWILTGDFNKDGKLDLALPDFANNAVKILLGKGNGKFQAPISVIGGGNISQPQGLSVGDFNKDGILDLAVTSPNDYNGGGGVGILLGNGDGTFNYSGTYGWLIGSLGLGAPGTSPNELITVDVNGDGNLDLLVPLNQTHIWNSCNCGIEEGNDGLVVLLGNGDGTFVDDPTGPFIVGDASPVVVAGDFNNDGTIDAAVLRNNGCCGAYVTVLINNTQPVSVSPLTMSFPARTIDSTSPASTVLLTNNQTTGLTISSVTMEGADPEDFPFKSACKATLSAGAYCTISITFKPSTTGSRTAELVINDGVGAQAVQISGTGK
ncbi:MAG TPA: FG-GAP-like repeat-containing protein [Candidatus Dormibacteraeota bacterium]|jgi:hypothetical protein|nr:FG-GAP-like repeat-containing protein [Candidatus Dormibacteraeota bacterium]